MGSSDSIAPQSLFDQKLDRALLVIYFVGAVVPLLMLAVVSSWYALPALEDAPYERATIIFVVMATAILTLASFLALRRLSHAALQKMDGDNSRLAALLNASRALSDASHPQAVAETAVDCVLVLTGASAAFVVRRTGAGKSMSLHESRGEGVEALYEAHEDHFSGIIEAALRESRPVSAEGGGEFPGACLAVPLVEDKDAESVLVVVQRDASSGLRSEEVDAVATLAGLTSGALQTAELQDSQRNFFAHTTDILVGVLDSFIDGRAGHAEQVARTVNQLGREMGLDDDHLRRLHFAALLHDIGMLRVDRKGHADPKQFMEHARLGHRMLSRIRLWESAAPSILHHHEWYDGSGYPDGLSRDSIPLDARIIAVADAFDAMIRPIGEGRGFSLEGALSEIRNGAGTQFDPEVVMAFARLAAAGSLSVK